MRNFKLLKQVDFSGGMNSETPDASSSDTQLRRIVNLLPSEDGNALMLRPAFEGYPSIPANSIPTGATILSIFPFTGWVSDEANEASQTSVYRSDDLIVAYRTVEGNTVVKRFVVALQSGTTETYYPIGESLIKSEMIWTSVGVTPPTTDGETTPPPSYTPYTITLADTNITWSPDNLSPRQNLLDDYWVAENVNATYGDGTTNRMGENDNEWPSEADPPSWNWGTSAVDENWADQTGSYKWAFDIWHGEASTGTVVRNNPVATGYLRMMIPWQRETGVLSVAGVTDSKPRPQTVQFSVQFPRESNVPAYILIERASSLDKANRFRIYYKRDDTQYQTWTEATVLNGVSSPVVCYNQTSGQYAYKTYNGIEYIKIPMVIPWTTRTLIKVEALPSISNPAEMAYDSKIAYIGVD